MSGIYIPDMELPKDGDYDTFRIFSDGTVINILSEKVYHVTSILNYEQVTAKFKTNIDKINNNQQLKTYRITMCDKCVWSNFCFPCIKGNTPSCPSNHTYKRDPPDGGYYG